MLDAGVIGITNTQGIELGYDAAGNRRSADSGVGVSAVHESYVYDDENRLLTTARGGNTTVSRTYDAAGRMTESDTYTTSGAISEKRTNTYNSNGWLTQQDIRNGSNTLTQRVTYTAFLADGQASRYQVAVYTGTPYTNTYTYTYRKDDAYKESVVSGSSTYFQPGATTSTFDVNGNVTQVTDTFATNRTRTFVVDTSGRILRKTEAGNTQYYFYANGNPVGSSGALAAADFDYNYTPVSSQYPPASPGNYVVSQGDTLSSIALTMFGDAQLWYVIADANGIRSDSDLKVGQQIVIPNKITNLHNTSATFKVYNPSEIIGDTTPTLPDPPPPPDGGGGCGGIGIVIIAVIAIAATVMTAGAAAVLMAGEVSLGSLSAGLVADVGMAVLGGGAGMAGIGLAAGAAAVGSIASQEAAVLMGMQDDISLDNVALSAIGAGATAGIGMYAEDLGVKGGTFSAQHPYAAVSARAAMTNAVTQGIAMTTGYQDQFNWRSLAVSAAVAPLAAKTNVAIEQSQFAKETGYWGTRFAENLANGTGTQAMRAILYNGGKLDYEQIAADAFGNMLGNSISGTSLRSAAQETVPANTVAYTQDRDDRISPNDKLSFSTNQQDAYDAVRAQGKSEEEAVAVANQVGLKDQLEAQIALAEQTDPARAAQLKDDYNTLKYALADKDVYFNNSIPQLLPSGMSRVTDPMVLASLGLSPSMLGGEESGSGYYGAVYYDKNTNGYIVANRGTEGSWADIKSDFTQAQGWETQQYKDAERVARAITANTDADISFTGHSLGGGLAALQALAVNSRAYTFNAAGLSSGTIERFNLDTSNANNLVKAYSVTGEILNASQDTKLPFALLTLASPPVGVAAMLTLSMPPALGERQFTPAVSLPAQTSQGVALGELYGVFGTVAHTLDLHKIDYVIGSLFYKTYQSSIGTRGY